jgi:chemotaxis protein MotB
MATKKLKQSEIKKGKCSYPDPPDEGLPIWMGTFADMMTLLFAFFVLLFSMATLDPVKYSAFQNAQADQTGGVGEDKGEGSPIKSQIEIKEELENLAANLEDELKEKMKKDVEDSDMDERLKKEKIKEIEDKEPLKVSHDPRGVALEIDGEICFGSGSINLKEEIKLLLNSASELMLNPDDKRGILVEGHTDNDPVTGELKEKYKNNWGLSAFRASEVVTFLIEEKQVAENRLVPVGYADQWPAEAQWMQVRNGDVTSEFIAKANKSPEQKAKNRRIKIIFATR